ncbi:hypothetical protein ACIQCR_16855 [Streptomyces sp. NPDC093249]|uniref:hypothetical protein n=1 Tax=unclassified Streptomyces TaxID=2593676 RepID=UPI00382CB4F9
MSTAITPEHAGVALARRVAEHLPHRNGHGWTVTAHTAWWTTRPAARLTQTGRTGAVIVALHTWRTELAFQVGDEGPYAPDVVSDRLSPKSIAREILRLVLPRLDDAALEHHHRPTDSAPLRQGHLSRIADALRAQGAGPTSGPGALRNSDALSWDNGSGVRYRATLVGMNPAVDLAMSGPVATVEAILPLFLDEASLDTRRTRGVTSALGRRLAAHLAPYTTVDRLDDGGLSIGTARGPFGYVAPPADPGAPVDDDSEVTVELHGVGVDHLTALAPLLTR